MKGKFDIKTTLASPSAWPARSPSSEPANTDSSPPRASSLLGEPLAEGRSSPPTSELRRSTWPPSGPSLPQCLRCRCRRWGRCGRRQGRDTGCCWTAPCWPPPSPLPPRQLLCGDMKAHRHPQTFEEAQGKRPMCRRTVIAVEKNTGVLTVALLQRFQE